METHPAILYKFITSQAGSRGKAMMELVQNSIDAGATRVDITYTQDNFSVCDDGAGFGDEEQIHAHFGTFGTPHVDGDARFGRFRLGRGQIMAFARTVWHTPGYQMDVDVKERGLNYILRPAEHRTGVRITGEWYEPLDGTDPYTVRFARNYEADVREMKDLMKYSDVPVYLNGEQITTDPAAQAWDKETDEAYFSFKGSGSVKVYNLGFAVTAYASYRYGSATVVTKKHLALNMARNSILESECPVWKAIVKTLRESMVVKIKKDKLNDDNRSYLLSNLRYNYATVDDVKTMLLITLVTGTTTTIGAVVETGLPIMAAPKGDSIGQAIHREGLAYVISEETLARAGCETIGEFKKMLAEVYRRDKGDNSYEAESIACKPEADPVEVARQFMGDNKIVPQTTLTPSQRVALAVLQEYNGQVQGHVRRAVGRWINQRTIKSGESAHALAWTNGATFIAFTPQALDNAKGGIAGWTMLAQIFAHEYLHDEDDGEYAYTHSNEFYETLNNVLMQGATKPKTNLWAIAADMHARYLKLMNKKREESAKERELAALQAREEAVQKYIEETELPQEEGE
jgi:hypothetical protein